MALLAAAGIPAVAVLAIAGAELMALSAERSRMQDIADSVALTGANQLEVTPAYTVIERSKALFAAKMVEAGDKGALQVEVTLVDTGPDDKLAGGLKVAAVHTRTSFFGNMLPPGGFVTRAEATALRMRAALGEEAPLCLLTVGSAQKALRGQDSSRLTATTCLAHANGGISIENSALLKAHVVQSVGAASGRIEPEPSVGAEPLEDPFREMTYAFPSCPTLGEDDAEEGTSLDYVGVVATLPPGVHCGKVKADKAAHLTLAPGEHFFVGGGLEAQDGSTIVADDVVLLFDGDSKIDIKDTSQFDAAGRRTGKWAGFLIVVQRGDTGDFKLWSDNVKRLLGTVYVPDGKLVVDGSATAAEESAWTVVVAKDVELKGTANLVLNTNYKASSVPVPAGVGDNLEPKTQVRLAR